VTTNLESTEKSQDHSIIEHISGEVLPDQLEKIISSLSHQQRLLLLGLLIFIAIPLITTPASTWQNQAIIGGFIFFVDSKFVVTPYSRSVSLESLGLNLLVILHGQLYHQKSLAPPGGEGVANCLKE